MPTFSIAKGSVLPSLSVTLSDAVGAINVAGSSVKFQMRAPGSNVLKVDANATVDNPTAGTVHYDWQATDTDTPGLYVGWFHVVYTTGSKPIDIPNPAMTIEVTRGAG